MNSFLAKQFICFLCNQPREDQDWCDLPRVTYLADTHGDVWKWSVLYLQMGVSINGDTPQWMVEKMEHPTKVDDLRVPPF